MQLQERATGARFDLSPLPIGISDSSQKRPFRFRSGDCESNIRLVSHQEAPRRRRWREVSEAGCEISGGEKVFSRSFASFRGHVLAVYSLRRLPREWPKSNCSRSVTRRPRFASCHAVHAPMMPPPTTATSVSCAGIVRSRCELLLVEAFTGSSLPLHSQ